MQNHYTKSVKRNKTFYWWCCAEKQRELMSSQYTICHNNQHNSRSEHIQKLSVWLFKQTIKVIVERSLVKGKIK